MKSSVDVHNFLTGLDIPHEMFTLSRPARDVLTAAAILGIDSSAVVEPRFYLADKKNILVLVAGDKKIDIEKLKKEVGAKKIEVIREERLASLTGYVPGTASPIAIDNEITVYIDYYSLREDVVYTSGGDHSNILKIRSYDLVRATNAEIVDVVVKDGGEKK